MPFFFSCFNPSFKLRWKKLNPNDLHPLPSHPQQYVQKYDDHHHSLLVLGRLSWNQIQTCTSHFSTIIGSGGFSNVYLAHFPGVPAAVKVHCGSSDRLTRIYNQELQILKGLTHPHIVKLLGYCQDREEGVLVFEYVPNGTLQDKLHGETKRSPSNMKKWEEENDFLSWRNRVKIAFQLAQALEYLHHQCPLQIVHGDIKASNILLDQNLDTKLCDFGSAKMGFSSAVLPPSQSQSQSQSHSSSSSKMMMMGSPGYTDPHYLWTGIVSKKNDIYSFGVVVLELITGMEALNPVSGERLTSVSRPILRDPSKAVQMVDARLSSFDLEEVKAMATISAMCLCETPSLRPSASDIVNLMRNSDALKFPPCDTLSTLSKG